MDEAVFSILWLLCGLAAALVMLTVLGRPGEGGRAPRLRLAHRALGWLFTVGYLVFLGEMFPRFLSNGPGLPTPFVAHAYIGLAILAILVVKVLVARVFKRYSAALPYFGMLLLTLSLLVVGFTGIQGVLLWARGPSVTVQSGETAHVVSVAAGRHLLQDKCARCHALRAAYHHRKTEQQWRMTVTFMAAKDPELISTEQADAIVGFLAHTLGKAEAGAGE